MVHLVRRGHDHSDLDVRLRFRLRREHRTASANALPNLRAQKAHRLRRVIPEALGEMAHRVGQQTHTGSVLPEKLGEHEIVQPEIGISGTRYLR